MNKPQQTDNKQREDIARSWLTYSGMAFEFFIIIGVFTALGYFLDKKLHTNPLLVIVFLLLGLGASFYRIFKQFK